MQLYKYLLIAILCVPGSISAQDFNEIRNIEFKGSDSYEKYEPEVLDCANYLFNNPADENELERLICIQFILKWMEGTPDYTFNLSEESTTLTKGNSDLFGLYLAGLTKTVLDLKDEILNDEEMHDKTVDLLITFCENKENNMKPTRGLKKVMKDRE